VYCEDPCRETIDGLRLEGGEQVVDAIGLPKGGGGGGGGHSIAVISSDFIWQLARKKDAKN
jgi:hypothetical protein